MAALSRYLDLGVRFICPLSVMAAVMLVSSAITVAFGWQRGGQDFRRSLPAVAYVGITSAWILVLGLLMEPPGAVGIAGLLVLLVGIGPFVVPRPRLLSVPDRESRGPRTTDLPVGAPSSGRGGSAYLVLVIVAAAVLLFVNLADYAGTLMVWEGEVVGGFAQAVQDGIGVLAFAAQRLGWDRGLVSSGHASFLYGAGTYLLFDLAGFSLWTLRAVAAICALLAIPAIYLVGRSSGNQVVATAAAALFAFNLPTLFYGRYGTSVSGTLLAALLALLATWLLGEQGNVWWYGLLCGGALFLATLGYSPARLLVLALLACLVVVTVARWRDLRGQRAASLVLLLLSLLVVAVSQQGQNTARWFVNARGEQIMALIKQPYYLREYLGRPLSPSQLTSADRVEFVGQVLAKTVPEFITCLGYPLDPTLNWHRIMAVDPPHLPLFFGALLPLTGWGVACSLRRARSLQHLSLLAWFLASSLPVLLTTRVDCHRLVLLVVPLTLWTAFGLAEAARLLARARVPVPLRHVLALALLVAAFYGDSLLFPARSQVKQVSPVLLSEIRRIPGRVVVAAAVNHRELGRVRLMLLGRTRRFRADTVRFVSKNELQILCRDGEPNPALVSRLYTILHGNTVILAPDMEIRHLAEKLTQKGATVTRRGRGAPWSWRCDPIREPRTH